jgi:hypothetical protein
MYVIEQTKLHQMTSQQHSINRNNAIPKSMTYAESGVAIGGAIGGVALRTFSAPAMSSRVRRTR